MLSLTITKREAYDSDSHTFYIVDKDTTIQLEHSLISVQKWEAKWHKPFLNRKDKTSEETLDYIRCMCLTPNIKEDVFRCLRPAELVTIADYINNPMTATTINYGPTDKNKVTYGRPKKQIVTAELIYYWMISLGIPSEYRKWHLNQLMTLIEVINVKNTPEKKRKMSMKEAIASQRALNEANKKRFNTTG